MKNEEALLAQLIQSFKILPGIGEKSAQRMAFYLLEKNREGGNNLAKLISTSMEQIRNCSTCRNLTEELECEICSNEKRDKNLLCVVENPTDVIAIESSGSFKGKYFVLMGRLSPIDGVTPENLGIPILIERINNSDLKEIIIATSPTVEGDATSFYINDQIKDETILVSRIAYGVPMGGELEYVDNTTLSRAIQGRRKLD
ncbi:MAG: recombination protein RecR [Amoebophilaceae bacterium TMED152]|nr:recombination protein RecR [Gammaproteobacteria bacterium]RPH01640.1 MAG: recombination protein RecR [Amoebophilaceae bacterium TMED152]|tara:strand:+ start:3676 stop:4278 length:603 start_codon:yes stop_codon:yes gene_type:complete